MVKLYPSMTHGEGGGISACPLNQCSADTVSQAVYGCGGGIVPVKNCAWEKGVLERWELGTVDGACSCVGLSEVVAHGDCHPATYDLIEHSQSAVTASGLQGIPAELV